MPETFGSHEVKWKPLPMFNVVFAPTSGASNAQVVDTNLTRKAADELALRLATKFKGWIYAVVPTNDPRGFRLPVAVYFVPLE